MSGLEIRLEQTRRSVREAEIHVAEQIAVVGQLRDGPFPEITAIAEGLLRHYNDVLQQAQRHLRQLENQEALCCSQVKPTTRAAGKVLA